MTQEEVKFNCTQHHFEFVRLMLDNGCTQLRKQCPSCGEVESRIYKHSEVQNINTVPYLSKERRAMYDTIMSQLWQRYHERQTDIRQQQIEKDREDRKKEYEVYLQSNDWKRKSDYIKRKYHYKCVLCDKPAKVVHHLTYIRIYLEDERDLIALCHECHEFIHGIIDNSKILTL